MTGPGTQLVGRDSAWNFGKVDGKNVSLFPPDSMCVFREVRGAHVPGDENDT